MTITIGVNPQWQVYQQQRHDSAMADLLDALDKRRKRREDNYLQLAKMVSDDPSMATPDMLERLREGSKYVPALGDYATMLENRQAYNRDAASTALDFYRGMDPNVPYNDPNAEPYSSVPSNQQDAWKADIFAEPSVTNSLTDPNRQKLNVPLNRMYPMYAGASNEEIQKAMAGAKLMGWDEGKFLQMMSQKYDPTAMSQLGEQARAWMAGGNPNAAELTMNYQSNFLPTPEEQRSFEAQREEAKARLEEQKGYHAELTADRAASRADQNARAAARTSGTGAKTKGLAAAVNKEAKDIKGVLKDTIGEKSETTTTDRLGKVKKTPVPEDKRTGVAEGTLGYVSDRVAQAKVAIDRGISALDPENLKTLKSFASPEGVQKVHEMLSRKYHDRKQVDSAMRTFYDSFAALVTAQDEDAAQSAFEKFSSDLDLLRQARK